MAQSTYGHMPSSMSAQNLVPAQIYSSYAGHSMQQDQNNVNTVDNLVNDFGSFNIRQPNNAEHENSANSWMSANGISAGQSATNKGHNQMFYPLSDGTYVFPGSMANPASLRAFAPHQNWGATYPSQYLHGMANHNASNGNMTSAGRQWSAHGMPPVPELVEPRRTSWSSHEEASPQTPTFNPGRSFAYPRGNQSPATYSTPSPMSSSQGYYPHVWKRATGDFCIVDFWELMQREPAIPEGIPAPRSGPDGGRGTLDKILDNRDGTTNVYVRGLRPETTDEMLLAYGVRFGPVISCKSIIEVATNECKGFGFIKYHNYIDAENCIRGFYHRGYEAKFARQSHNARLKDLASAENTNLYVSNLPRLITEAGLKELFESVFDKDNYPNYQAGSCKILKDSCGISRGVGFARFETPQICEEIIAAFNNRQFGQGKDASVLSIRYADTDEQKKLKQTTAVKRQFKANEYNEVVHGIPFSDYSPTPATYQSPLTTRVQEMNGAWAGHSPASSMSPIGSQYPFSVLRSRQASGYMSQGTTLRASTDTTGSTTDRLSSALKIGTIKSQDDARVSLDGDTKAASDKSTTSISSMIENGKSDLLAAMSEAMQSPSRTSI